MSTRVQRRRGSAAAHATFIGAEGELTVMTDQKRLVVHDGATAGGIPMARLDEVSSEVLRAVGNADFSFQVTDRLVVPNASFTAPRTGTLPLAASVAAGRTISFFDALPALNGANVLTVVRTGSDTINGAVSFACAQPRGRWDFISDGVSKWSVSQISAAGVVNVPAGGVAATTVQAAINELDTEKAPLVSPALAGTPTAPTAATGTNTAQIATTAFVKAMIDAIVAAAPGALDTLDELAAALGDDANFAATITTALAGKQASLGFTPARQLGANIIGFNWDGAKLIGQVDGLGLGQIWSEYASALSLAASGYVKLPNGVIIQWGTSVNGSASEYTVTFPVAFPTVCFSVQASVLFPGGTYPTNSAYVIGVDNYAVVSPSTFAIRKRTVSASGVSPTSDGIDIRWLAIGA